MENYVVEYDEIGQISFESLEDAHDFIMSVVQEEGIMPSRLIASLCNNILKEERDE